MRRAVAPMIVEKFLSWSTGATPTQRADGASALARAYLYAALDASGRRDVEMALTRLLDDPSPLVRRALADVFAGALDAPTHIVHALAEDQSDVSAVVLARSPLLDDGTLVDCAAIGDAFAQVAIATRPGLSVGVAATLVAVGAREALVTLAGNGSADLPDTLALQMLDRFGADGALREALLGRAGLGAAVRCRLVDATASALAQFATAHHWLSVERADRLVRDARDGAHLVIAAEANAGAAAVVAHLRAVGQLTSALLLRSLLAGRTNLLAATLAALAECGDARVAAVLRDWRGGAFAALYRRAGLPLGLLPGFRAVLDALDRVRLPRGVDLSRALVEEAIARCEVANDGGALDPMMAILRRLRMEAIRSEARTAAGPAVEPTDAEPLLLADPDRDPRLLGRRSEPARTAPRFTIDFTALEAELLAA